jgi:thymidylate synthase
MAQPIVTVKQRKLGHRFLVAESWWIISGRNDVASIRPYSPHIASFSNDGIYFDGAYGPKVIDQLRYVVDTLEKDPDSRQAVIGIWRPNPRDSKDIGCTLSVQWLIRDGKLNCLDTMRSSDAWLGIVYDWWNFTALSAYVLLLLRERSERFKDVRLGTLYVTAGSQHLYVNPKQDGMPNIPYTMEDVVGLLGSMNPDSLIPYNSLNVDEFTSPPDFITHLELLKDRKDSGHAWLRELLLK